MKINLPHIPCFVRSFYELYMIPKKVTKFSLTEEVRMKVEQNDNLDFKQLKRSKEDMRS